MSKTKVYPLCGPEECYKPGHSRSIYKGASVAILNSGDVDFIESILTELICNVDDEHFKELDLIRDVIEAGKKKMDKLHDALGAFDLESDGKLTKPDSQKIDWSHLDDEPPKASLEIVKS